jgi:hypothetical protein
MKNPNYKTTNPLFSTILNYTNFNIVPSWTYLIGNTRTSDFNEKNNEGQTPLMLSLENDINIPDNIMHDFILKTDLSLITHKSESVIFYAIKNNHLSKEIFDLILNKSNFITTNKDGDSPLMAAFLHQPKLTESSWEKLFNKSNLKLKDKQNNTLIMLILYYGTKLIDRLFETNDLLAVNNKNENILTYSILYKHKQELSEHHWGKIYEIFEKSEKKQKQMATVSLAGTMMNKYPTMYSPQKTANILKYMPKNASEKTRQFAQEYVKNIRNVVKNFNNINKQTSTQQITTKTTLKL